MESELSKVDVHRIGNLLLFSCGDFAILKKVIAYIEGEGGRVLRRPHKLKDRWIASAYLVSRIHDKVAKELL